MASVVVWKLRNVDKKHEEANEDSYHSPPPSQPPVLPRCHLSKLSESTMLWALPNNRRTDLVLRHG